jgi:hypothetical protein
VCGSLIGKFKLSVLRKAKVRITVNRANGTAIGLQKMRSPLNALLLRVSDDAEHWMLTPKGRLDGYPDKTPFRNKVYIDKRNWNSKNIFRPADACPKAVRAWQRIHSLEGKSLALPSYGFSFRRFKSGSIIVS